MWALWRGTPDITSCDPCPAGRVCLSNTGNISQTNPCPEGHICGEAITPEMQTLYKCFNGFYCKIGTKPWTVFDTLCNQGFYCKIGTSYANRFKFRCPLGFYCPEGTSFKLDLSRPLMQREVYLTKENFYLAQKLAQFC